MPTSARLEIHEMNVGQGDSVLIINRNLDAVWNAVSAAQGAATADSMEPIDLVPYAISEGISLVGTVERALLIDGGDDEYGGDVLNYMEMHGVLETDGVTIQCPRLYLLVSHYHDDHLAGLRSVFKERVETKVRQGRKTVTQVTYRDRFRPARVYQTTLNNRADPTSLRFQWFEGDVAGAHSAAAAPTGRYFIDPGGFAHGTTSLTRIDLGTGVDGIPIQLISLSAAQAVWNQALGRAVDIASVGSTPDQNDRSVVMVLQYGSFRYFVGGDIAGNGGAAGGNTGANAVSAGTKRYYSQHADVESTLGPALEAAFPATTAWNADEPKFPAAGYCTAMKANHHGSSSSVDVHLLGTLRPAVVLISSGVKSRFHRHPTQEVMNRTSAAQTPQWGLRSGGTAANTVQQVYVTEVADRVKGTAFGVDLRGARIVGDIVLRPVDESIQAVHAATSQGQAQLQVQVYGTGEQTGLADPRSALRAAVARNTAGAYPIGPWYHADTH